jgi:GTP-binding protein HflX
VVKAPDAERARALIVGVALQGRTLTAQALNELHSLAESAQLSVVERLTARRDRPDPALYLGSGKVEEIKALVERERIEVVVFDDPISPVQQRNLNRALGIAVMDRVELILDIFAQRARSHEGKLQVELARIEHQLTRLVRSWSHLERQRGGFGQRGGPGEKQVELDRRMLDSRAKQLKLRLAKLERQRETRRRSRMRRAVPQIALVGYTNAGKSSLFNALTHADSYAADQLFATLDTTTRQLQFDRLSHAVLSDTVGFVRNLPHSLVQAFRATLEETAAADLLLHVVDASNPQFQDQMDEVDQVLKQIGAQDVPTVLVFNKADLIPPRAEMPASSVSELPCDRLPRFWVSAHTGEGLSELKRFLQSFSKQDQRSSDRLLVDDSQTVSNPNHSSEHDHDAFVA